MKKKFSKIWGIGLTVMLLASLMLVGAPVAVAAPDIDEWVEFEYPLPGEDGDWFRQGIAADREAIKAVGPIAEAIDDTLYAYTDHGRGVDRHRLMKSDDGGRTWEATAYSDDPPDGVAGGAVVAIVCSSIDEEIVYAADENYVYKTDDGGDTWDDVRDKATLTLGANEITCLAVGYDDDEAHVYIGTADPGAGLGGVYHLLDEVFGGGWTDLELDYDVYGIGCSPDFDSDALVVAVATDGTGTFVCGSYGASTTWDEVELKDDATPKGAFAITEASDPAFPADFDADDAYEFFVGVAGDAHDTTNLGGVYRLYDTSFYLLDDVEADIISLDLVGDIGGTLLLAGVIDAAPGDPDNDVWYSWDDGDKWELSSVEGKNPSGDGPTYVVMDPDFDEDTGIAWAATAGDEGAVSMTADGGVVWNQISLISTDIDDVLSLALSPEFSSDETLFMLTQDTTESLFRYDGDNWERVYVSSLFDTIDVVAVSPDFASDETLFVTELGTTPVIYRSTDGGQTWDDLRSQPDELNSWVIIDDDTIIAGGDGEVYKTDGYGKRAWDTYDVVGAEDIMSFALSPAFDTDDTIIVGDESGQVFISEDAGEEWDIVGEDFVAGNKDTLVAFDPGFADSESDGYNVIYAAAGGEIDRFLDVTDDDEAWDEYTKAKTDCDMVTASGILVSADGTLYASDANAANPGVLRCLNPLEEDIKDVEFERAVEELDAVGLDSLQLTAGSNVLWAVDISTATIWTYEDTLAVPVELTGPSDGKTTARTDRATVSWEELDSANKYFIEWDSSPDFDYNPDDKAGHKTTTYSITTGIEPGQTFYWRVRVMDPVLSKWSEVWSFTLGIAGGEWNPFLTRDMVPGNVAPQPGAGDVPIRPTFQWNAADWATSYEFQLADNPDFTGAITRTLTTTAYAHDADLNYSTTYYWQVRAKSDTSQSEWGSAIFTTEAESVEVWTCPQCGLEFASQEALEAHIAEAHGPPATPFLIWVIVAIGALLVIAVIVLIVRTRRVA